MQWQSCCRGRSSNCPKVALEGRKVWIKDDDGNRICVTLGQFTDISWKIKELVTRTIPGHRVLDC